MTDSVNEIIAALQDLSEEKRIKLSKKSFPTSMRIIGVTNPNMRIVLGEIQHATKDYNRDQKIRLIQELINTNIFECQQIAFEYLSRHKSLLKSLKEKEILALGNNLDNWVSVDAYSIYIFGAAWQYGIVKDKTVLGFLNKKDFWMRRVAVVSTVDLNLKSHGGTGDAAHTIDICKRCVDDHHDMIVKAVSWALRELSKRDKVVVEDFINDYEDRLHSKVLREVRNKLVTGKKN